MRGPAVHWGLVDSAASKVDLSVPCRKHFMVRISLPFTALRKLDRKEEVGWLWFLLDLLWKRWFPWFQNGPSVRMTAARARNSLGTLACATAAAHIPFLLIKLVPFKPSDRVSPAATPYPCHLAAACVLYQFKNLATHIETWEASCPWQ